LPAMRLAGKNLCGCAVALEVAKVAEGKKLPEAPLVPVIGRFEIANGRWSEVAVAPTYRPRPQTPTYNNALVFTCLNF
jgi:hypothetical protein